MNSPTLASESASAFLAAIGSFLTLWIGYRKGFFILPKDPARPAHPPTLLLVLSAFAIYIGGELLIPLLWKTPLVSLLRGTVWIVFTSSFLICAALYFFFYSMPHSIRLEIWHRRSTANLKQDILIACFAWLISFPLVLLIASLVEISLYFIFHTFQFPDQLAILFLKMTFGHPLYLFLAATSIVLLAPLIEEFLFRGALQSYLRRYLRPPWAIAISSLLFALFHYSSEQGLGNISILLSLFALGCFLGFIYERQGSLRAPLFLHALFNAISALNLYFLSSSNG